MKEIDPQLISEKISKAKEVQVLGLRGTGHEGDILDILIDGNVYLFCIGNILQSDETKVEDTTKRKERYTINIVGHCFIEHKSPEDALGMFYTAISSVSESNDIKSDVVSNKGNLYKIKFDGSVNLCADSFAMADNILVTAINAVVVDKDYDCYCKETTTTTIRFIGDS